MSTQSKRILVTLATGNQGSGLVRALARRNQAAGSADGRPFEILAVTRNASSDKAQKLAALPGVTLLESDYEPESLFEKANKDGPIYGVFSVQTLVGLPSHVPKGPPGEAVLGKQMADAAAKYAVKHFVYSSVDMGGLPKTDVPHFESKRSIEEHIAKQHASLPTTILRPVAFMDNFSNGESFLGKVMNTFLTSVLKKPIQLISATDIGEFAALAFEQPDKYIGKTISLASDEMSPAQILETYKSVKGVNLPTTFAIIPAIIQLLSTEARTMFRFFNTTGYKAHIAELRTVQPSLKTFRQYIETEM